MCVLLREKQVCIRKARVCFGCEALVAAGTTMSAQTNRGDGRIYTLYLCARCQEAEKAMPWIDYPFHQGHLKELWIDAQLSGSG